MKAIYKKILPILIITAAVLLVSCSKVNQGELLSTLLEKHGEELPPVTLCRMDAAPYSEYVFEHSLSAALYGRNGELPEIALLSDFSFITSKSEKSVCDVAVFTAESVLDVSAIEEVCRRRGELLAAAVRCGMAPQYAADCKIITEGRRVVFICAEKAEKIEAFIFGKK